MIYIFSYIHIWWLVSLLRVGVWHFLQRWMNSLNKLFVKQYNWSYIGLIIAACISVTMFIILWYTMGFRFFKPWSILAAFKIFSNSEISCFMERGKSKYYKHNETLLYPFSQRWAVIFIFTNIVISPWRAAI